MTKADPSPTTELWQRAEQYANKHFPRSKVEPTHAGLGGAAVFGFALAVFSGLRGGTDVGMPGLITIAIGFAVPYFYCKWQNDKYYKEIEREYQRLQSLYSDSEAMK